MRFMLLNVVIGSHTQAYVTLDKAKTNYSSSEV